MVNMVVMPAATATDLEVAEETLKAARSLGRVARGVWVVATKVSPRDLRARLSVVVPDKAVLVVKLSGTWASHDFDRISAWLKEHGDDF
jgi:hypothetical protein